MTGVAYASSRLVGTAMIASTTLSAVMVVSTPASTRSPSTPPDSFKEVDVTRDVRRYPAVDVLEAHRLADLRVVLAHRCQQSDGPVSCRRWPHTCTLWPDDDDSLT